MAAAITVIGVVGAVKGIGTLIQDQSRMNDREKMYRLAYEKFQEIEAIQDFSTPSGDFTDRNDSNHLWQMELNQITLPQTATTTANSSTSSSTQSTTTTANQGQLEMLKVTVHPSTSNSPKDQVSVSGVVWESPQAINGVGATQ